MSDKDLIDYEDEDIKEIINPEKAFLNRILQSLNLTRVVLYCGKKFLGEDVAFITIPDISIKLNIRRDYTFQLIECLVNFDILKKQKTKGEKRIRYFLKNKEKLILAIKTAKSNL